MAKAKHKTTPKEEFDDLKDESPVDLTPENPIPFAEKIKTIQIAPEGIRKGKIVELNVNGRKVQREQIPQRK